MVEDRNNYVKKTFSFNQFKNRLYINGNLLTYDVNNL